MLRWLDELDAYEDLVLSNCEWPLAWQRDTVLARVARARQHYGEPFRTLPGSFALESPLPGDTAWAGLSWSQAADPDSGDRVTYRVRLGTDSTLADAQVRADHGHGPFRPAARALPLVLVVGGGRGPGRRRDRLDARGWAGSTSPACWTWATRRGRAPPRARPNPSRSAVALQGMGARVVVYDLAGRRVAWPGHGIGTGPGGAVWDGLDGGRPAAPGVYLARGAGAGRALRIVRLR